MYRLLLTDRSVDDQRPYWSRLALDWLRLLPEAESNLRLSGIYPPIGPVPMILLDRVLISGVTIASWFFSASGDIPSKRIHSSRLGSLSCL